MKIANYAISNKSIVIKQKRLNEFLFYFSLDYFLFHKQDNKRNG